MRHDLNKMLRFTQFAVDNLADAAYCIEEDASIVYVNDAATQMLGYSREELLSMRIYELNADVSTTEWPVIWRLLRQARKRTFEARHRAKDGRLVPVEVSANLLLFEVRSTAAPLPETSRSAGCSSSVCARARR